jgi:hypothetical protein
VNINQQSLLSQELWYSCYSLPQEFPGLDSSYNLSLASSPNPKVTSEVRVWVEGSPNSDRLRGKAMTEGWHGGSGD